MYQLEESNFLSYFLSYWSSWFWLLCQTLELVLNLKPNSEHLLLTWSSVLLVVTELLSPYLYEEIRSITNELMKWHIKQFAWYMAHYGHILLIDWTTSQNYQGQSIFQSCNEYWLLLFKYFFHRVNVRNRIPFQPSSKEIVGFSQAQGMYFCFLGRIIQTSHSWVDAIIYMPSPAAITATQDFH